MAFIHLNNHDYVVKTELQSLWPDSQSHEINPFASMDNHLAKRKNIIALDFTIAAHQSSPWCKAYFHQKLWIIRQGMARVTLDKQTYLLTEQQSLFIPALHSHKIENLTKKPLKIIEINTVLPLSAAPVIYFADQPTAPENDATVLNDEMAFTNEPIAPAIMNL